MSDPTDIRSPFQFRLIDAVAIMTIVALVSAMTAPLFRALTATQLQRAGWALLLELAFAAIGVCTSLYNRAELLRQGGTRLVRGFRSSERTRYGPELKSLAAMASLATVEVALGIGVVRESKGNEWLAAVVYHAQLSFVTGRCTASFLTKTYPFTVDIFEKGIGWGTRIFVPWDQVSLRRSSFGDNRVVVVVRIENVQYTLTVFMDPHWCETLIRRWGAKGAGVAPSVGGVRAEVE